MEDKKQIFISDVLEYIRIGKTREEIREIYELSRGELVELFKHPQLKGRRTRQPITFSLIDDVTETAEEVSETTQENVQENVQEEVKEEVYSSTMVEESSQDTKEEEENQNSATTQEDEQAQTNSWAN